MAWSKCKHCDSIIIDPAQEECASCRRRSKCGNCGKPLAVMSGHEYCQYCEPILWRITFTGAYQGERSPDNSREYVDGEEAMRAFREWLQEATYRSGPKQTVKAERQYIEDNGKRVWELYQEATIQTDFRRGRPRRKA